METMTNSRKNETNMLWAHKQKLRQGPTVIGQALQPPYEMNGISLVAISKSTSKPTSIFH
jgi:hypothetical protein